LNRFAGADLNIRGDAEYYRQASIYQGPLPEIGQGVCNRLNVSPDLDNFGCEFLPLRILRCRMGFHANLRSGRIRLPQVTNNPIAE
jgi:hypothetical protein